MAGLREAGWGGVLPSTPRQVGCMRSRHKLPVSRLRTLIFCIITTSTLPRMHAIHKRRFLTKRCALLPYACSPPTSHSSRRWLSGLKISGTIPPNVANMTQLGEMYVFLLRYHLPHRAAELSRAHFSSRHSLFLSSHDVSFSYHIVLLSHSRRMSGNAISGTIPNEFVALKKMSIL